MTLYRRKFRACIRSRNLQATRPTPRSKVSGELDREESSRLLARRRQCTILASRDVSRRHHHLRYLVVPVVPVVALLRRNYVGDRDAERFLRWKLVRMEKERERDTRDTSHAATMSGTDLFDANFFPRMRARSRRELLQLGVDRVSLVEL